MDSSTSRIALAAVAIAAFLAGGGARAGAQDEVLYGLVGGSYFGSLLVVDRGTGGTTAVGELGVSDPEGLDCAPDGTLWGSLGSIGGGEIVTVDRSTGVATPVGPSGFDEVAALAIALDGTIYASVSTGSGDTADGLATVDPSTGAATLVGGGLYGLGITGMVALAVNSSGTLYGVSNDAFAAPALYTIDATSGVATLVAPIEDEPGVPLSTPIIGLAFAGDGTLYATTEYSTGYFASPLSGTTGGDLLRLDPATGSVLALVGSNDATVAALAFCRAAAGPRVFAILPQRGGNEASVDAVIYHGLSLGGGATVELVGSGEPAIAGGSVAVDPALHRITATFDLTGATPGPRDVVVTDATDPANTGTLANGFTVEDGSVVVLAVRPRTGGDSGKTTVVIQARYVAPGATVKLVRGGEEILASPIAIQLGDPLVAEPATITATFDLAGRALGAWDVVVANASDPGSPGTLPGVFTIAGGAPFAIAFDVSGPNGVRVGRPSFYVMTLRNEGNVDATAMVAISGVPADATWEVQVPPAAFGIAQPLARVEDTTVGPAILLPGMLLPPGVTQTATLTVRAASEGDFEIRARLVPGP